MCSIEEAWAGQTFQNYKVQSQSDLHRKYMSISPNLLERNNEVFMGHNEPQSREGLYGLNTKQMLPLPSNTNVHNNDINQAFTVSKTVEDFMGNNLLNEDNEMDTKIVQQKMQSNNETDQIYKLLHDIIQRLDRLDNKINMFPQRNIYDIILYILAGMLISFILYAVLRKVL